MNQPSDLPERNVALLRKTQDFIEQNPSQHDQGVWHNACGTAFCYAGHAALLAGAEHPGGRIELWHVDPVTLAAVTYVQNPESAYVGDFARKQLGLTEAESDALFDASRTLRGLRSLVNALCTGAWINDYDDIWINGESRGNVDKWLVQIGAEPAYKE